MIQATRSEAPKGMKILVLVPVFNDWASLDVLVDRLDGVAGKMSERLSLVIVNDGSVEEPPFDESRFSRSVNIEDVEVINLACNLGHQRALAIGLSHVSDSWECGAVVVMDADGEDRPEDIPRLIQALLDGNNDIAVAERGKRTEGAGFRVSYFLFKLLFRLLVGRQISFGNFCAISSKVLYGLTSMTYLWSHLAATIVKSGYGFDRVKIPRAERYAGNSKMNFYALVEHGLNAVSVFRRQVLVRIIVSQAALAFVVAVGIGFMVSLRLGFGNEFASPGWATTVVGVLSIIFLQSLTLSVIVIFRIFGDQSGTLAIPRREYKNFIDSVIRLKRGTSAK